VRNTDNTFELVEGVIDKDRTACLIALSVKATHFLLLTGVPNVCVKFGTPKQKGLFKVSLAEIQQHYENGEFPSGSMGPKIEAAMRFTKETKHATIITNTDNLARSLDGEQGTIIRYQ
jgi:carbamate kinase